MSEKFNYQHIVDLLARTPSVTKLEQIGMCRLWTAEAIRHTLKFIRDYSLPVTAEAREVNINRSLSHTFLKLMADGDFPFLIDNVGVENFPPYIGYEHEAPPHLHNSHFDILNYYL